MAADHTNTLIIGASIAGLASAAALQKQAIDYVIIERSPHIATPWRNHYDRLHLHSSKRFSNLPYKKFPKKVPRYPSRQQVLDYLEDYQKVFNITPQFNTEAIAIKRKAGHWLTQTSSGAITSNHLIMATGAYTTPKPLEFRGIETFPGRVLHSSAYKTGRDFKGQNVLVVGFGNSACEIAIDLYEQGATPSMAVRSPVNIVPRDIFGIPILELSILLSPLRPNIADIIARPLTQVIIGDITKLGLQRMPYGPLEQIRRDGHPPVLDIGTLKHIRQNNIRIRGDIDRIDGKNIHFKDGKTEPFDAIVAAIGYYRDYKKMLHVGEQRFDDLRLPVERQKYFGKDGLYFCGYWISPTGQIRTIASDAQKIAKHISSYQ